MTKNGNVLLLEDDPIIRSLLEFVFADDGHSVFVCESREELLEAAVTTPGALAVTDFWGDSHQTLADHERAQVVQLARAVPTILVMARTWASEQVAQEVGLLAVVRKPFDVDGLAALVSDALDGGKPVALG